MPLQPITDGNEPALMLSYPTPHAAIPSGGHHPLITTQDIDLSFRLKNPAHATDKVSIVVQAFGPYTVGNTDPVTGVVNVKVPIYLDATGTIASFKLTFDSNASGAYFFYPCSFPTGGVPKQLGRGIGVINFT